MTEPGPSDAELLRAHVGGEPDAFGELFRRHRDRLWAVALRTLADREEAADALQDALLSAHRAADRFRGDSAVTTWLHRIVVNACLDRLRRRKAHPTVPMPEDPSGREAEPAAPVVDHDTTLVVREALARLPTDQRTAIVLVDLQGYSVAEVAELLEVAEGTVKSRCARGRARLAVLLGHLRPGPDRRPPGSPLTPAGGNQEPTAHVPSKSGAMPARGSDRTEPGGGRRTGADTGRAAAPTAGPVKPEGGAQ